MATVSDVIENFILNTLGQDNDVNLSRNDLATFFNCAPSQINYVLSTRFNVNRGFVIESQRGGGGYIKVVRISNFDNNYLKHIINQKLNGEISFKDATFILEDLVSKRFLSPEQAKVLSFALQDKALINPIKMEGKIRCNILKNALANILIQKGDKQ